MMGFDDNDDDRMRLKNHEFFDDISHYFLVNLKNEKWKHDVEFLCSDGKRVTASSILLILSSDYFKEMFKSLNQSNTNDYYYSVSLKDYSEKILIMILDFICYGFVRCNYKSDYEAAMELIQLLKIKSNSYPSEIKFENLNKTSDDNESDYDTNIYLDTVLEAFAGTNAEYNEDFMFETPTKRRNVELDLSTSDVYCQDCNKQFKSSSSFQKHLHNYHDYSFMINCGFCKRGFSIRYHYIKHGYKCHMSQYNNYLMLKEEPNGLEKLNFLSQQELEENISDNKVVFDCFICKKSSIENKSAYFLHLENNHSAILTRAVEKSSALKFHCQLCDKMFLKEDLLNSHLRVHEGKKPYKCDLCNKSFARSISIQRHKKSVHEAIFSSTCELCGKLFVDNRSLTRHTMLIHGQSVECDICHKKFSNVYYMTKHKAVHSTERNFVCDVCGFATKTQELLTAHKPVHDTIKKYRCDKCDKSFKFSTELKTHRLVHTGIRSESCDLCDKTFYNKYMVKAHKRMVHERVQKYECKICCSQFATITRIRNHLVLHTDFHPFRCEQCGDVFKHLEVGRRHFKAKHSNISKIQIKFIPNDNLTEFQKASIVKLDGGSNIPNSSPVINSNTTTNELMSSPHGTTLPASNDARSSLINDNFEMPSNLQLLD